MTIMQKTIHVKNIEKYHPGYKDRHLIWCKTYFSMLDGDNEFEMLEEIDKWRFVAFTILELKLKKPIPNDEKYLTRKGFDFKKKSLEKTLDSLSPFIDVCNSSVTESGDLCNDSVTQIRIEENRIEENRIDKNRIEPPDWIPKNEWNQFLEMRKKIKKPPTEHAKKLLIKDLDALRTSGENIVKVLNQSIKFNWQGLFKENKNHEQIGNGKREIIGKAEAPEGKYHGIGEDFTFE